MDQIEPPELTGLVLAGGLSRRMRTDKGSLDLHGRSQAEHCLSLIAPFCVQSFVSIRAEQSRAEPYSKLATLADDAAFSGPAAGLLTAWSRFPRSALLVLAVDLVAVTRATLAMLVAHRDAERAATAFCHPDGTIEPLCTIWEPRLRQSLVAAGEGPSLRRILEGADIALLRPERPDEIVSANTPESLAGFSRNNLT